MNGKTVLDIIVSPKSSKNSIALKGETIKVYLTAAPVDGKANAELITLLSKKLRIAKSAITIIRGETGRRKRISFDGLTVQMIHDRLKSG